MIKKIPTFPHWVKLLNPGCFCLGYDMSTFIRRYGRYLNEKAFAYRQMAFDFTRVKKGYVCWLVLFITFIITIVSLSHVRPRYVLPALRAWWGPWPLKSCWRACLSCKLRSTHSWSLMYVRKQHLSDGTSRRHATGIVLFSSCSQVHPKELNNGIINAAFLLLFKDLVKLFASYNDGIINLLG